MRGLNHDSVDSNRGSALPGSDYHRVFRGARLRRDGVIVSGLASLHRTRSSLGDDYSVAVDSPTNRSAVSIPHLSLPWSCLYLRDMAGLLLTGWELR